MECQPFVVTIHLADTQVVLVASLGPIGCRITHSLATRDAVWSTLHAIWKSCLGQSQPWLWRIKEPLTDLVRVGIAQSVERRTRDRKVRNSFPSRSERAEFSPEFTFCAESVSDVPPPCYCSGTRWNTPVILPKVHTAGYNETHIRLRPTRSRSGLTTLSRHSMGTYQGNELTRNSPGNARLRSSRLAEPGWRIPGLKKKKERKKEKKKGNNLKRKRGIIRWISPSVLAREDHPISCLKSIHATIYCKALQRLKGVWHHPTLNLFLIWGGGGGKKSDEQIFMERYHDMVSSRHNKVLPWLDVAHLVFFVNRFDFVSILCLQV